MAVPGLLAARGLASGSAGAGDAVPTVLRQHCRLGLIEGRVQVLDHLVLVGLPDGDLHVRRF